MTDDGDARSKARARGLRFVTSMWTIAEANKCLDDVDGEAAEQLYVELLATDMRLPGSTVSSAGRTRWAFCRTVAVGVDRSRRACHLHCRSRVTSIERYVLVTSVRPNLCTGAGVALPEARVTR